MASCNPNDLAAQASCLLCLTQGELSPIILSLICQKSGVNCDINSLVTEASCFACQTPGIWPILENILWCKIAQAIAGGSCDPNTLMASAGCFACLPSELWPYLEAQMLCNSV
jgi:hypothetical protein